MEQIEDQSVPEEILDSPEDILRKNIENANVLLDTIMDNIIDGRIPDAKMIEATARIIDAVTNAADKLICAQNDLSNLLVKKDALQLKYKELELSGKLPKGVTNFQQNNVIVTNREDLLKLLEQQGTAATT